MHQNLTDMMKGPATCSEGRAQCGGVAGARLGRCGIVHQEFKYLNFGNEGAA